MKTLDQCQGRATPGPKATGHLTTGTTAGSAATGTVRLMTEHIGAIRTMITTIVDGLSMKATGTMKIMGTIGTVGTKATRENTVTTTITNRTA